MKTKYVPVLDKIILFHNFWEDNECNHSASKIVGVNCLSFTNKQRTTLQSIATSVNCFLDTMYLKIPNLQPNLFGDTRKTKIAQ